MVTHSLMRLADIQGSTLYGAEPMATHCRESGVPLENVPGKVQKEFASTKLRNQFHARRRERGSQLYDLLMADKFDQVMTHSDTLQMVAQHLRDWREDDISHREGRPSWNKPPVPE